MNIQSIKQIEALHFLNSYKIQYLDKSGNQKSWELVSRGSLNRLEAEIKRGECHSDGAMIFAVSKDKKKLCMIKEFRVSAGRYVYALPAGLSDSNENIESAAIREFKEETGMNLEIIKVDPARYTSIGLTNESVSIVYGYFSGEPSSAFLESTEDISVEIIDRERAIEIVENEIIPIRSYLLLSHFFNLNPFLKV